MNEFECLKFYKKKDDVDFMKFSQAIDGKIVLQVPEDHENYFFYQTFFGKVWVKKGYKINPKFPLEKISDKEKEKVVKDFFSFCGN